MAPVDGSSSDSGFPAGLEHLDPNRLLEGYTDRGSYAEWTAGIDKSPNDARDYRLVKLKNGLECMLVHDPTAQSCAASMAVRVGHLQDPEELPGLAHFLEHLLFMGSAKFPGENEYSEHLSKFNGWSNAYTSTDQTVYFFEVTHGGFVDALDRFAQFFISPLFNETCVEREIKAVDSEHQKNLQNDTWRLQQLRRSLAKSDHPYHKFGTGSLDTLWTMPKGEGLNIRAELIKFYEKHYSANLMKLCIITSDPLDTTLQHTLEFFNQIPNVNILPTIFPSDPYPPSLDMSRIAVKQIQDKSFMLIQMPFYDSSKVLGVKPATMLSYLIGNEGPHSLYGFLKKKGLVTYVSASPFTPAPGIYFYVIYCGLTNEGVKQHQKVASIAFEYVRLLKSQPFPSWVFKELKQIYNMHYRFLEAQDSISDDADDISTALHKTWPRSQIFSAPFTLTEDDPEKIKEALGYITKEKAQIFVASNKDLEGLKYDQREKWYGTEYVVEPLKSAWFEKSLESDEKLSLPEENHFIPSNFELYGTRNAAKPFPRPLLVKQTEGQRIWFKQDDTWKIPKGLFSMKLSNPFLRKTYKNGVLAGCYIHLVHDALTRHASDAAAGGLSYQLYSTNQHLVIQVSGFTEKLPKFYKIILHELKNLKVTSEAFDLMKEAKLKALSNESHDSPVKQCIQELAWILNAAGSTFDQRKDVLNAMKAEDIEAFAKELLSTFYAEALCHGNFTKTTMYDLVNMTEEVLDYTRLPREAIKRSCSRIIPEKSNYFVRLAASSKEEVNNAIRYYTNVGHPNDQDALVRLYLLQALIAEPCFNVLRTQQQLGYIVGAGVATGSSHCGLYVTVQSARSPVYLETRINAFLEGFAETLSSMDLDKFESAKNGLIANLLEPHKNQESESDTYWGQIDNGLYDFFRQDRIVAMLKPLSLKDIHAFFMKYVHPASETRAKVSVHLYSHRVHSSSIDKLLEVLDQHKIDTEPVKKAVHDQPLPKALREMVEKHIKETAEDLHHCCQEEILREVDKLEDYPEYKKDLPGVELIKSTALKDLLKIGEPRKPIGDFYDGVARL